MDLELSGTQRKKKDGFIYALVCYGLWGFFPIYWKWLEGVPPLETLTHRIAWSFLFMVLVTFLLRRTQWIASTLRSPRTLLMYLVSSLLISFNWGLNIWAVVNERIIETALGYFMNPLVTIILGALILKERPRRLQWISIAIAAFGVLYLSWAYGELPWVSLGLAISFAFYGLIKKQGTLGAVESLTVETALLFLPSLGYLIYLGDQGAFGVGDLNRDLLLVGAGVATAFPLIMFSAAARRLSLTTLGIMQYLGPTVQLVIGVFLYNEPLTQDRLVGFLFIWGALILFTFETLRHARQNKVSPTYS